VFRFDQESRLVECLLTFNSDQVSMLHNHNTSSVLGCIHMHSLYPLSPLFSKGEMRQKTRRQITRDDNEHDTCFFNNKPLLCNQVVVQCAFSFYKGKVRLKVKGVTHEISRPSAGGNMFNAFD
jgi:hypothetical protein